MSHDPTRRPGAVFAVIQAVYGAFVALGSAMELALALGAEGVPDEVVAALARLHASPWVSGWVVVQGLVMLPLGLAMGVAAIGLRRGGAWAVTLTLRCALAILAIGGFGQLLLAVHLYPPLCSGALGIADGVVFCGVMIMAGVGMMIWPAIAAVVTTRHRREALPGA